MNSLGAGGKHEAELLTCTAGLPAEALEGPKTFFPISHIPSVQYIILYIHSLVAPRRCRVLDSTKETFLCPVLDVREKESANARLRIGTRLFFI